MKLEQLFGNEEARRGAFPVTAQRIFLAHAGVAPLPRVAVDAMREYLERGSGESQENPWVWEKVREARAAAARLLRCVPEDIALVGPTSFGLNLVANGLPWRPDDEVVYYGDDYPANVYPWTKLQAISVKPVPVRPERPGKITWETIEAVLTGRTRLVALSSCHFLSGYRIDVETIGRRLRERNILFCVDGIQTLGAFPLSVEFVDFLSADSHKWLLGPAGAGIFYVRRALQDVLKPTLLGSWNVVSPRYVAQDTIQFWSGGRRYEPGTLNLPGILGMLASIRLLLEVGIENISRRILELRRAFLEFVEPLGFTVYGDSAPGKNAASGIISLMHPTRSVEELVQKLQQANVIVSLRYDRSGTPLLRLSPHFYNTPEEIARTAHLLR